MRVRERSTAILRTAALSVLLACVGRPVVGDTLPVATDVDIPATPVAGGGASSLAPTRAPDLSLLIFDVKGLLGPEIDEAQQEVRSIFAEMGVSVGFKLGGLGTTYGSNTSSREIPIIVLDTPPGGVANKNLVLGLVPKNANPTAVWIFAGNIKKTLGIVPDAHPGLQARRDVAVAAGRVIAHETVHALAPHLPHSHGLMRWFFDKAALRGAARPEQEACVAAVQEALHGKARPAALPTAMDAREIAVPRF